MVNGGRCVNDNVRECYAQCLREQETPLLIRSWGRSHQLRLSSTCRSENVLREGKCPISTSLAAERLYLLITRGLARIEKRFGSENRGMIDLERSNSLSNQCCEFQVIII